jgi:hypothetical protein
VKRWVDPAVALWLVLAAVPARAQVPLVVGSVRDQHGIPVAGATVTGRTAEGGPASAATDVAGTFALRGDGIAEVRIACRYCRALVLSVVQDVPVVAIVQRYDALADDSPSVWDLANLPYAHVESAVALRPFTLLSQTSAPYPGSALSDRGLSPTGSLLIDNGTPNYDITAGQSPYVFIPAQYQESAVVSSASNAFAYGDQAAGGIVQLTPFASGTSSEIATLGSDVIVRAQAGSDAAGAAFGSFSNDEESRQRGDVFATFQLPAQESLTVTSGSEQSHDYESPDSAFAGSFSFANVVWNVPQALNFTLSALTDCGNYFWTQDEEYPVSTAWSDTQFSAGIHTDGPIVGFADAAVRSSTGFDDLLAVEYGTRLGATLSQSRVAAGLSATGDDYDVTAGVGAFWFDYAGGTLGVSQPAKTALAVPSVDARLFPNGKWSVNLQGSGSFTLPTFVEQYYSASPGPQSVALERNSLAAAELTYTDDARVRFSFEDATQNVAGASTGKVTSAGFSAVWQIAPALALRAWTMHVTDTAPVYSVNLPSGGAATVNAFWLTYDPDGVIRADLIYRRDLLDDLPFYHVDGAISGPIAERLRWYAGAEDRQRRTFVDVGLRFAGR